MSIILSGSPQTLTAGYNPVYFYASSDNVNQPDFRYLVSVNNESTSTVLANLKIKPRFGDDLLEVNLSKILDNDLGCFSADIDFNSDVAGFNNTISSGYKYGIDFGEEYATTWYFNDVVFNAGGVRLSGDTDSGYVIGDQINVTGAAEPFYFTDNQFDSGALAFLVPTGHTIVIGDTITVFQDAGYTYEQYQGEATVTNVTGTLITTDKTFAGGTPVEGGVLYRNYAYDGLHLVTSAFTSGGFWFVDIDQAWINNSPTHGGFTRYYDGRISQNTGLTTTEKYVFNGAIGHNNWTSWNSDLYDPSNGTERLFLTTLPDNWTMTLDNDAYLNIWGNKYLYGTTEATLTTYNSTGGTIGSYTILNDLDYLDQTEIVNLSVGPRGLNLYHPNIVQNGTFQSTSFWTVTGYTGADVTISGGTLNYYDPVGDGLGLATQTGILTPGCDYLITIEAITNDKVGILAYAGTNSGILVQSVSGTGIYSVTITADGTDFVMEMGSGQVGVNTGVFDNLTIQQLCPIIDCDVSTYDIQILSGYTVGGASASETLTFNVECECSKYTNYPLLFKDRMGSFVPFNFSLSNKQKVNVDKRDNYKKFIGNGGATSYTYSNNERSMSTFNTEISEEWTLNTDWLTEAEAAYFEELVTSPVVSILINNEYRAVYVTDKRYERVRKINKKNIRYSIDIQFSNDNTIQGG